MNKQSNSNRIKRITLTGMLAALSLVLGYFEALLPINIGVPGVKLGIANTVVLYAVSLLDAPSALALVVIKVLLSAFLYAGASSIVYSLSGGLLSLAVMLVLKHKTNTGTVALSVAGAVAHNVGQIAAACLMLQSFVIVSYLPLLLATGSATGVLTGIIAKLVISRLGYDGEKGKGVKEFFKGLVPVLLILLLLGAGFLCVNSVVKRSVSENSKAPVVIATVNGKEVYRLSPDEYGYYPICDAEGNEINSFKIDEHGVSMESATCKNSVCLHTGHINPGDGPIVCIPNRVMIRIEGGISDEEKFTAYSFDFFDTSTEFTGFASSEEEFENVKKQVFEKLEEYNVSFDCYNLSTQGKENIASLNVLSASAENIHDTIEISLSKDTMELLEFGKEMYFFTNGKADISLGKMLNIWHEERTNGTEHPESAKLPSMEELKEAAECSGVDNISIDLTLGTVSVKNGVMIDTGAVAKGFTLGKIKDMLGEEGYSGYMLNIGGNVYCSGTKNDGSKWNVGIENPLYDEGATGSGIETKKYLEIAELENMALATSGSYQRYYVVAGQKYHHIIDPDTLMPENRWISVSVLSSDPGLGDTLSTALFNMTLEDGLNLVNGTANVEALWLNPEGEVFCSDGFKQYCK